MLKSKVVYAVVLLAGPLGLGCAAQGFSSSLPAWASQGAAVEVSSSVGAPDAPGSSVNAPAPASAMLSGRQLGLAMKHIGPGKQRVRPFSKLAISTKSSTLGDGGQFATPLMRSLNLRAGAGFVDFGAAATIDGARYEGQIHLKDGMFSVDWFPFNLGFHISPGVVIFKSALSASVYVPGGNSFDLGNNTFTSSPTDPVTGSASILFSHSIMPALTIGFGNMIAKAGKHWSVPLEVGAAYTGHYTAQLNLVGSACINVGCMSTGSAIVQQSLVQEQDSLNEPMKHYQLFPIFSSGVSYRF